MRFPSLLHSVLLSFFSDRNDTWNSCMWHTVMSHCACHVSWLKSMTSQGQVTEAEDPLLEPFRVRYGQHDLGLHIDIRACLLRASKEQDTNIITVSDTEGEEEKHEQKEDIALLTPSDRVKMPQNKS